MLPSEYGTQHPPWFPFTPEYWHTVCAGTNDDCCLKEVETNRRQRAAQMGTAYTPHGTEAVEAVEEGVEWGTEMMPAGGTRRKQPTAASTSGGSAGKSATVVVDAGGPYQGSDAVGKRARAAVAVPVEAVPEPLRQQEDPQRMRCVRLQGLRKEYERVEGCGGARGVRAAVDGLDLTMYAGQVNE